ncbi:hypothetical protein QAD02_008871 [Eretmocerus hayati]|uniref:Uncharacterized protein n=1 Tax=Eretmocerus hayati TaxID=131215 RepID=A0ACC2N7M1_9HYME|nr:hypothetical protein QAD02_008871 [Eretmocerus hayati]
MCGGALITKNHVLTAAHCLYDLDLQDIQIVAASSNLRFQQRKIYRLNSSISYDEWAGMHELTDTGFHDIAVIELDVQDTKIEPVSLTKLSDSELVGKKVTLAGWGDSNNDDEPPSLLQKVSLTILDKEDCEKRVSSVWNKQCKLSSWMMCIAAEPWALGSNGDSGSPILDANNDIVGVLSAVSEGTLDMAKCVNSIMQASYYKKFIREVTMGEANF